MQRGTHAQYMSIFTKKKAIFQVDFGSLKKKTEFPFALLISQSETEEVLTETLTSLGVKIHRPFRVSNLEDTSYGIKVIFESGEVVKARYVVGTDGSRSTVRPISSHSGRLLIEFADQETHWSSVPGPDLKPRSSYRTQTQGRKIR